MREKSRQKNDEVPSCFRKVPPLADEGRWQIFIHRGLGRWEKDRYRGGRTTSNISHLQTSHFPVFDGKRPVLLKKQYAWDFWRGGIKIHLALCISLSKPLMIDMINYLLNSQTERPLQNLYNGEGKKNDLWWKGLKSGGKRDEEVFFLKKKNCKEKERGRT